MSPYFILAERALPLTQTCHSDYKIRNTYQHHFLWEVLGPKKGGQWPIKDWPFDLISKAIVMHRGKCLLSYLPHLEGKHFTLLLLMDLWVQYHFYPTEKGVILTLNLEWGPPPKKKTSLFERRPLGNNQSKGSKKSVDVHPCTAVS